MPFHPKAEDVTKIIPQIRAQQERSSGLGGQAGIIVTQGATLEQLASAPVLGGSRPVSPGIIMAPASMEVEGKVEPIGPE